MQKNKGLKGFILVVLLVMALSNVAFAASKQFTVANHTGYTIHKISISPAKMNKWGENLLGSDTLENRAIVGLNLDNINAGTYDLKISFVDDSAIEWRDIKLLDVDEIILKNDGTAAFK